MMEYKKWKLDVLDLSEHYKENASAITNSYFDFRYCLKTRYLKNPNCLNFTHVEPLPQKLQVYF